MTRKYNSSSRNRLQSDRELLNAHGREVSGGRDVNGIQMPYEADPLRERSLNYTAGGYLSAGYDSGRS